MSTIYYDLSERRIWTKKYILDGEGVQTERLNGDRRAETEKIGKMKAKIDLKLC